MKIKTLRKSVVLLLVSYFMTSCALQRGLLEFEEKQDEIIATSKIKEFIKKDPNPSIVLRVPSPEKEATQSDPNSYIYNAIEKELIIAGFDVKDRGLFNEVLKKSDNTNYSEIKRRTGTDLIMELVRIETDIKYRTNGINKKNREERISNYTFTRLGAVIEFKVIIIENNIYGGSYSFYYTPCTNSTNRNDCGCYVGYRNFPVREYPYLNMCESGNNRTSFEVIDQNIIEDFIRNGVKQFISEIWK